MIPFAYHRRSLATRRASTLTTIGGIAAVVFVLAASLMLGDGVERSLRSTGRDDQALVMRRGATAELQSLLSRELARTLSNAPEVVSDDRGPIASAELVVLVVLAREDGGRSNVTVRGVGARAFEVHWQARAIGGGNWSPGRGEILVGQRLAARLAGARPGGIIRLGRRSFRVAGLLTADGSAFESEIWGDADELMDAFSRPTFSTVTARVRDVAAYRERVEHDARPGVDVRSERQYYQEQSRGLALFVRVLGAFMAVVLAIGAVIGAAITMYGQVAARVRELGTLRALGFRRRAVVAGVLLESALLAVAGGIIGLLLAALLQRFTFSIMNFASLSEMVFRFRLTLGVAVQALAFSLVIGVTAGLLPALRAARLPIVEALRD